MDANAEKELVQRAVEGDMEAFEQLVLENETFIYNSLLRMCKNQWDAQDLTQETFLRAYKNITYFKGESSVSTWLFRICRNVCTDMYRKRSQRSEVSLYSENAEGEEMTPDIADEKQNVEDSVLRSERAVKLRECIAALPPRYRDLIVLKDINGMDYAHISEMLEIPEGTVKSRLSRARERLKKLYERCM